MAIFRHVSYPSQLSISTTFALSLSIWNALSPGTSIIERRLAAGIFRFQEFDGALQLYLSRMDRNSFATRKLHNGLKPPLA